MQTPVLCYMLINANCRLRNLNKLTTIIISLDYCLTFQSGTSNERLPLYPGKNIPPRSDIDHSKQPLRNNTFI